MKALIKKQLASLRESFQTHSRETFAQCGEDIILKLLFDSLHISKGVYVDIGANDPRKFNNTYSLYKAGWRGVNIDPQAHCIREFNRVRPEDQNLQIGLGNKTGTLRFYVFDADTLSTFDPQVAKDNISMGHRVLSEEEIPMKTVGDLINEKSLPSKIDLLSLDTEGGELDLLQQFMRLSIKPSVLICETLTYHFDIKQTRKETQFIQSVCEMGYFVFADTYINSIFVRKDLFN